jgi:hypothetical protein
LPSGRQSNTLHAKFYNGREYNGREMATTVTVKGQLTLPKAVREAAGIRPGSPAKRLASPDAPC